VHGFPLRVLIVTAAFAPALPIGTLLAAISVRRGRPSYCPIAMIAGALSVFCVFAALLLKPVADSITTPWANSLFHAFVLAAVPEEAAKLCLFLGIALRHEDVDPEQDCIVAGGWLGLGFALMENFFYVSQHHEWLAVAGMRMATAVPAHVAFGLTMGALVARARNGEGSWAAAIGVPVLLHGLYDWPLGTPDQASIQMRIALEMPVLLVMAAMVAFWIGPELADGGGARLGFASDPVTLRKWRLRGAFMAVALVIAAAGSIVLACGAAIAGSSSYWLFANAGLLPLGLAGLWRQSRPRNIPAFEMRNPADAQDAHDAESRIEARIRRIVDRPTLPRAAP
jgi:RsiW-degrading membrane proteinase PrsW (M82 family)